MRRGNPCTVSIPALLCGLLDPSGVLLRAHRRNRGLTQADLARRTVPPLSTKYISDLETGRRKGGVYTWRRLADALSLEVFDFIPYNEQGDRHVG